MTPRMSENEIKLLLSFLICSESYVEFGAGGTTCLAAATVRTSVISIDSSQDWLTHVAGYCAAHKDWVQPKLMHVDIGPVGNWGWPTDASTKSRWPAYHTLVWDDPASADADLFMVDGRFRVACFIQTLLHCRRDAVIAIHDFQSRTYFHIVTELAREVARCEELSLFIPAHQSNEPRARAILRDHLNDAA